MNIRRKGGFSMKRITFACEDAEGLKDVLERPWYGNRRLPHDHKDSSMDIKRRWIYAKR